MSQDEWEPGDGAAPSGKQVIISEGRQEAAIVEVGGGIRSYHVQGRPVLDGYDVHERCTGSRGQPLIPWPNRLSQGRYDWDGQQHQAPINEVDKGNALHGFTRWHNWTVNAVGPNEAAASLRLHPQQGYPFVVDLTVTYTLGPGGLTVTNTARNVGADPCPYAYGAHPYITVGTALIDEATLTVPAATCLPSDEAQIPIGREAVDGTPCDFRQGRVLGATAIDLAYTDLTRDDDGLARVTLSSAATRRSVAVWLDSGHPWVMIFTGHTLSPPSLRRRGLAIEPMTCPPNGFATGIDVARLEPGASITTRWGIVVEDS